MSLPKIIIAKKMGAMQMLRFAIPDVVPAITPYKACPLVAMKIVRRAGQITVLVATNFQMFIGKLPTIAVVAA